MYWNFFQQRSWKILEYDRIFVVFRRSAEVKDGEFASLPKEIAKLREDMQKQWNNTVHN